jgi:hypothetical protein
MFQIKVALGLGKTAVGMQVFEFSDGEEAPVLTIQELSNGAQFPIGTDTKDVETSSEIFLIVKSKDSLTVLKHYVDKIVEYFKERDAEKK